jgi:hypothetical protein
MADNDDKNEVIDKDLPSYWYSEAKGTLVYSLSELVFGSLLASFILGFIGFSSSILYNTSSNETLDNSAKIIRAFTYLSISGIYTYYTAGLYLIYHTGILSMPTFNLKSARRDFSLSLLSAVAFGFSMLWPKCLLFFLSILIFWSLFIQLIEHNKLVKTLYNVLIAQQSIETAQKGKMVRIDKNSSEKLKLLQIEELLRKSKLDGWKNTAAGVWIWSAVLLLLGVAVWLCIEIEWYPTIGRIHIKENVLLLGSSIIVFLFIFFKLRKVFNNASTFFRDHVSGDNYDKAYKKLRDAISKL